MGLIWAATVVFIADDPTPVWGPTIRLEVQATARKPWLCGARRDCLITWLASAVNHNFSVAGFGV
jgi:hypothetical protein